ncbi:MAG: hypothetical protein ACMUJM_24025 [bacterium]
MVIKENISDIAAKIRLEDQSDGYVKYHAPRYATPFRKLRTIKLVQP